MPEKPNNNPFYAQGLYFSCTRCSACCRYETGYVYLSQKDVSLLLAALCICEEEFLKVYCRWSPIENGISRLSLKEKSNYDCIFWTDGLRSNTGEGGCLVYEARPLQCRAFPFWSSVINTKKSWKLTGKSCPGMNRGILHPRESIEKWLALRQNEPIIAKSIKI